MHVLGMEFLNDAVVVVDAGGISQSVRLLSANIMKIPPNAFKHYQQHNHNQISSVGCFAWWPNQVKFCGNFQINIYNSFEVGGISARRDDLPLSLALTFQETNLPNQLRTRSKNESFANRLSLSIETRLPVSKEYISWELLLLLESSSAV